jgi:hypothetical protein
VEEFIRWVFAEDSATDSALGGAVNAVKGAVKDVVLLVAGPVNKTDQRNLVFFLCPPK